MAVGELILYGLVTNLTFPIWIVQDGAGVASQVACAARCHQHYACGGFKWNSTSCRLVVHLSVPGAVQRTLPSVFRLNSYRTNYILNELPPPSGAVGPPDALNKCQNKGMDLLPYPATLKDRASLSIRQTERFYVDMKRAPSGKYVTLSSGDPVPNSAIFEWGPNNPAYGSNLCIGLGRPEFVYFDFDCSNTSPITGVMCVYRALQ
ncbi:uncharacterized protein LOC108680688 [Hyalella azteca]|uniref:Uncharacterized protein LOC108680688 n=1 Tax=Hyalella azteca TaxID=294128 RepID=A0A8B7PFY8_HYAAZ|nr:uncharacterized protein LOC108680688 [Hyalella azteca]